MINETWNVTLPTNLRGNVTSCVHFLECIKIKPKFNSAYSSESFVCFNINGGIFDSEVSLSLNNQNLMRHKKGHLIYMDTLINKYSYFQMLVSIPHYHIHTHSNSKQVVALALAKGRKKKEISKNETRQNIYAT